MKLYYTGLNEYNVQNGNATNSTWQVVDEQDAVIVGDKVEFIANGDGKIFTSRISSLVKLDKQGKYFLIDYTEELKDLTDGAQIKLVRPQVFTQANFFFEQCINIPVNNGKIDPSKATGFLNYFDSYMVNRQIPIPVYGDDGEQDVQASVLKTFTFPFEHHSPSDFWGAYMANRGRQFVENPYENKECRSTEIALSKAISNNGLLNGLSYFDSEDAIEYDKQDYGSITTVLSSVGFLTIICQNNNFQVGFDDETIRITRDGQVTGKPADQRLGRPQMKVGSEYGCHVKDINTIREYNGLIMWLDRSRSDLVEMYGSQCSGVAAQAKFQGHLTSKIKHMIRYNSLNNGYEKYFHSVFDPKHKKYILTLFKMPSLENPIKETLDPEYVNRLREKSVEASESIVYTPGAKSISAEVAFTPEYFGTLSGDRYDTQLFSFRRGRAWFHNTKAAATNKSYLNFFGQNVEVVYEVVLSIEQAAEKIFSYTEVMCRQKKFFADRVLTESRQVSRILNPHWEKIGSIYSADFKMDINTKSDINIPAIADAAKKIFEGNPLVGKWIKVRYVAITNNYFELDSVKIYAFLNQSSKGK